MAASDWDMGYFRQVPFAEFLGSQLTTQKHPRTLAGRPRKINSVMIVGVSFLRMPREDRSLQDLRDPVTR